LQTLQTFITSMAETMPQVCWWLVWLIWKNFAAFSCHRLSSYCSPASSLNLTNS